MSPNPTIVCNGKTVELTRDYILEPTQCPFCGGEVGRKRTQSGSGAVTICKNPACPKKDDGKLKTYIKKVEILGIGDSIREALRDELNICTPADLYLLGNEISVEQMRELTIGGSKLGSSADAIVAEINAKRDLPLHTFLGSLGIDGLGRRETQLAAQKSPHLHTLAGWRSNKLLDSEFAANINAPSKAGRWHNGIQSMADIIDLMLQRGVVVRDYEETSNVAGVNIGKLVGVGPFVFTGAILKMDESGKRYTRERMHQTVLENGGTISDKVASTKTILVQADLNSVSSKSQKAKQLGAKIMSEAEFWQLIDEQTS